MFIVYINDLPSAVTSSNILLFADGTKCYKTIHSSLDCHLLQLDLNSLTNWSHINHLLFKASKCNFIRFLSNSRTPEGELYSIDGREISKSNSHRDLGIVFSANMSCSSHYDYIVSKAYRALGLLRRSLYHTNSVTIKKPLHC